jgi:tetratricopeptide (TPR) repeat protein
MSKEPTFRTIADLFQVPDAPEPTGDGDLRPREGRDGPESRALGQAALNDGDHARAIEHFRRAIEQGAPGADLDLAAALDYSGQELAAYRQYRLAKLRRDDPEAQVGIADILKRASRFRDAVAELRDAAEKHPTDANLWQRLAQTLRDAGEKRAAYEASLRAILARPDDAFLHYWLGDLLLEMGRDAEALEAFRAAIELSPGDDHLYLRTAVAMWRLGRRAEALKAARLASDLDPEKLLYSALIWHLSQAMGEEANPEPKLDRYDRETLDRLLAEMGA